jgi:hypothetical protein
MGVARRSGYAITTPFWEKYLKLTVKIQDFGKNDPRLQIPGEASEAHKRRGSLWPNQPIPLLARFLAKHLKTTSGEEVLWPNQPIPLLARFLAKPLKATSGEEVSDQISLSHYWPDSWRSLWRPQAARKSLTKSTYPITGQIRSCLYSTPSSREHTTFLQAIKR